jgi:hypothetical protein
VIGTFIGGMEAFSSYGTPLYIMQSSFSSFQINALSNTDEFASTFRTDCCAFLKEFYSLLLIGNDLE